MNAINLNIALAQKLAAAPPTCFSSLSGKWGKGCC